jgi:hypothetical protein
MGTWDHTFRAINHDPGSFHMAHSTDWDWGMLADKRSLGFSYSSFPLTSESFLVVSNDKMTF